MLNSEQFDKQLGGKIKDCRLALGYSQPDLARVLGFDSATAISLIENGERSLKIRDLVILCQLFQKDYTYFLGDPKKVVRKIKFNDGDVEEMARRLLRIAKHKKSKNGKIRI